MIKQQSNKRNYQEIAKAFKDDLTQRMQMYSTKRNFTYLDAKSFTKHHTKEDKVWIEIINFIEKPIRNQFYIYCNHYYSTGEKLPVKMFKHDLSKLDEYYKKIDEAKAKDEPFIFNKNTYFKYVMYVTLKLKGAYKSEYDEPHYFDVKDKSQSKNGLQHNREYNPACYVPSVMRGELPYNIIEYDIERAHPNFIAKKYDLYYTKDIYAIVSKRDFATALNAHKDSNVSYDKALSILQKVFGLDANKVLTKAKYNQKGALFKELCEMEAHYINEFLKANRSPENAFNYVRLHDGIIMLSNTKIERSQFDDINFKLKPCTKPEVIKSVVSFYDIGCKNEVVTSVTSYRDFLQSEQFIRVWSNDDKVEVIKNENNIVEFYNHSTEIVKFLENHIAEYDYKKEVTEQIAKDRNVIFNSLLLLPNMSLKYHKDEMQSFGLLFKNGFYKIAKDNPAPQLDKFSGFFAPHKTQKHEFNYLTEKSIFEMFMERVATGKKSNFNESDVSNINAFKSMIGYMAHNYKNEVLSPAIILSDHDANGTNRNGGRGKSLITKALEHVQKSLFKGAGSEFNPSYQFNWDDLEKSHNIYIVDDVAYNFKYDDLYTNILGGISAHKKGKKAETIDFKDSPKFIITTNWVVLYDENDTSTHRRFIEYKLTDYYNKTNTPAKEFNGVFFASWNQSEWNRFYSYIFNCVHYYLNYGIQKIDYNKTDDNMKAYFQNDVMFSEFERIFNIISRNDEFSVTDFLKEYQDKDNPLKYDKLFHKFNIKNLIDVWIKHNNIDFVYNQRLRKWINQDVKFNQNSTHELEEIIL